MPQRARRREAERAGRTRVGDEGLHGGEVIDGRRLVLVERPFTHDVVANGGVSDHATDMQAFRRAVEPVEVPGVSLPVPREAVEDAGLGDVLDRFHHRGEVLVVGGAHGRKGHPAVADHDRSHAMPATRARGRIPRELRVEVSVDVDESRRDQPTLGVESRDRPDSSTVPIATIRSPSIAMSATADAAPVPSTTVPSRITRSCAIRVTLIRLHGSLAARLHGSLAARRPSSRTLASRSLLAALAPACPGAGGVRRAHAISARSALEDGPGVRPTGWVDGPPRRSRFRSRSRRGRADRRHRSRRLLARRAQRRGLGFGHWAPGRRRWRCRRRL